MAQEYISQASEEIEGRVNQLLSIDFSRTESRILGALSKLNKNLPNPQVGICSVAVPGASRNNGPENRETTGDRSLGDDCPKAVLSACHAGNVMDSEQEETHNMVTGVEERLPTAPLELRQEKKEGSVYKSATVSKRKHPCDNWSRPDSVGTSTIGDEQ